MSHLIYLHSDDSLEVYGDNTAIAFENRIIPLSFDTSKTYEVALINIFPPTQQLVVSPNNLDYGIEIFIHSTRGDKKKVISLYPKGNDNHGRMVAWP